MTKHEPQDWANACVSVLDETLDMANNALGQAVDALAEAGRPEDEKAVREAWQAFQRACEIAWPVTSRAEDLDASDPARDDAYDSALG